jgi:hypothetical protein
MLIPTYDTERLIEIQPASLVGDTWTTEVGPRLPVDLTEQARALKAFQRVRGLAPPHDLRRGLLAYVLGPLSTRRLGAWAVLIGFAELAAAAGRKRLRRSNAWRVWLLSARVAGPETPAPTLPCPTRRRLRGEASGRGRPGGCSWPTTSSQAA